MFAKESTFCNKKNKDNTHYVTLWRVSVTIIAMEKQ